MVMGLHFASDGACGDFCLCWRGRVFCVQPNCNSFLRLQPVTVRRKSSASHFRTSGLQGPAQAVRPALTEELYIWRNKKLLIEIVSTFQKFRRPSRSRT